MNFGQNFLDWVVENAGPIAMGTLIIIALYCLTKRKILEMVALIVIAIIAFVLIYNPVGVKDVLLDFGSQMLGIGSGTAGLWIFSGVHPGVMFPLT